MHTFPKGILIDTEAFIADERGRFNLSAFVSETFGGPNAMSSVTAAELLIGVEKAVGTPHFVRKRLKAEGYLTEFPILDFDLACARRWAVLTADLQRQGRLIDAPDLLIAATAMRHGYAVATFNVGEFSRVRDLVTIPLG